MTLPDESAGAKLLTLKDVRGHRYTEIFLIDGNGITRDLKANVYNTWVIKSFSFSGNTWYQAAYGANRVYYRVVPTP